MIVITILCNCFFMCNVLHVVTICLAASLSATHQVSARTSIRESMLRLPLSVTGKESGAQLVCLVCGGPETGDSFSHFLSTIKTQHKQYQQQ
jgi:hypothetical protein